MLAVIKKKNSSLSTYWQSRVTGRKEPTLQNHEGDMGMNVCRLVQEKLVTAVGKIAFKSGN